MLIYCGQLPLPTLRAKGIPQGPDGHTFQGQLFLMRLPPIHLHVGRGTVDKSVLQRASASLWSMVTLHFPCLSRCVQSHYQYISPGQTSHQWKDRPCDWYGCIMFAIPKNEVTLISCMMMNETSRRSGEIRNKLLSKTVLTYVLFSCYNSNISNT